MKTKRLLLIVILATLFALSSCKGVRVVHGKDCGCGSFGQVDQQQKRPQ